MDDGAGTEPAADLPPLYRASVPVLLGVLDRLAATLAKAAGALGPQIEEALLTRPAPGMMPAGQQVATTVQFALRTAFPLAGQRPPELRGGMDAGGLAARIAEARRLLEGLDPAAFAGAETRRARGQAGFAEVDLPGDAFLHRFGLPNLYFHHAMAHVALKQAGARLGKTDFDGVHVYPEGFSFG
jgi:uncharacterized protein